MVNVRRQQLKFYHISIEGHVLLYRGPCAGKLHTGLIMYYPLKIKNIVLYCIPRRETLIPGSIFFMKNKNLFFRKWIFWKEQINTSRNSWYNIFYTFTLISGTQIVQNLIQSSCLYSTQFPLHAIRLIQLLSFYCRSKGNVQLVMYFSEVIRVMALDKGTLGFVRAKCITKWQPLWYKNKQKQMYNFKIYCAHNNKS